MKINKSLVLGIIGTMITTSGITYAATKYLADDITYTKITGEEVTVQNALNELFTKVSRKTIVKGASAMENGYSKYIKVNLGFKPSIIIASNVIKDGSRVDYIYRRLRKFCKNQK